MTLEIETTADIPYGPDDLQRLDVIRPEGGADVPVVAYFHGGAWRRGDKAVGAESRMELVARFGVAVVSANYRLLPGARFPAQVHDVKAVIRFIRAHGQSYGLSTEKVGAWGASAGGYLAAMAAVTNGDPAYEGDVGDDTGVSSRVDAVVDWFAQTDLWANSRRSWLEARVLDEPFEGDFLGEGEVAESVYRDASILSHITAQAPPFLIGHGDRDRITPVAESSVLHDSLTRAGARSTFLLLGGAGHEGVEFDRPDHLAIVAAFLKANL